MKTCEQCGSTPVKKTRNRFCSSACSNRARRQTDPAVLEKRRERKRETATARSRANRGQRAAYGKAWREANRERHAATTRAYHLRVNYGLTAEQYDAMFEAQAGRCAICRREPGGSGNLARLHVDHCDETQVIRGLLCQPCNTSIGKLNHDPLTIRRAARYVENPPQSIPIRKAA
jgi:hypothetical protein